MEADKKPEDKAKQDAAAAAAASDQAKTSGTEALNKPTDEKDEKKDGDSGSSDSSSEGNADSGGDDKAAKKPNGLTQTFKKFRLYLLIIALIGVIGVVFAVVTSINGKKTPPPPSVQSQSLSQSQLKQLAKSGTPTSGQTLTIQGNAVLDGQATFHNNLYIAGDLQSSGNFSTPQLTLTNTGSFAAAQASSLEVSTTSTFQGVVNFQNGMNVNGPTSFSTASIGTLTATKLVMNNGTITVPSHLMLTGAFPHRTISFGVLGNGGSASVNGSDTNGTVSINTGNNPQPGCFLTIIFNQPWIGTPNILLGPINQGAGATEHSAEPIVSATTGNTTGFKICTANAPLPNQAFGFSYLVNNSPN